MEGNNSTQWPNSDEVRDLIGIRDHLAQRTHTRKRDHTSDHHHAKSKGEFELAENGGDLVEERRLGLLLGRRAPRHIDAEHMRRNRLADVDGDAAEEDGQERQPFQVLEEGSYQAAVCGSVAQDGERNRA